MGDGLIPWISLSELRFDDDFFKAYDIVKRVSNLINFKV